MVWDHPDRCLLCDDRIVGRHRRVEPFAFRGWDAGRAVLLDRTPTFHTACWRAVVTLADAAEVWEAPMV